MKNRNILRGSTKTLGAALIIGLLANGSALAALGPYAPLSDIIALNQKPAGDAVSISYAFLPQNGTLDIYALDQSGKIGKKPLGKISLNAGEHRNVKIELNSSPKVGMRLRAVIEISGQPLNTGDKPDRTFKVL
jgi:hypothetical protein